MLTNISTYYYSYKKSYKQQIRTGNDMFKI